MKSERRHELETNELADWIGGLIAKIKPYQNAILGVVLLGAVAGAVYAWMSRQSAAESGAAWDELYSVMLSGTSNPADFDAVATSHPGTTTAHWATVLSGEVRLARGCNELFTRKDLGREELKKAEERFLAVLEKCPIDTLRERATFGLAQTHEAQGDLGKAVESWSSPALKDSGQKPDRGYRGVMNLWPGGTFANMAQKRVDDLETPSTKAFYGYFAKWKPKSPLDDESASPGVRPPTDLVLPDERPLYKPGGLTSPGKAKPSGFPEASPGPAKKPASEPAPKEGPSPKEPSPKPAP